MQKRFLQLISTAFISSSMLFSSFTFANTQDLKENIEVTQQKVTKDELAAIYVFSESCPSLVEEDAAFKAGYQKLLKDYLPNENSPQTTLNNLIKQQDYQQALAQARQDAKNAGDKANQQVCEDIKKYQSSVK